MLLHTLTPFLLGSIFSAGSRRDQRRLADVRKNWSREISRERNMDVIAMYHISVAAKHRTVDAQTWEDLGMDELFAKIDRTVGTPGRQILYHQMRTYEEHDSILAERARQQAIFQEDGPLRERCQFLLARLNAPSDEGLASLLFGSFPQSPRFAPLLYLCSLLSFVCLTGMWFIHILFLPLIVMFIINASITARYGWRIMPFFYGFSPTPIDCPSWNTCGKRCHWSRGFGRIWAGSSGTAVRCPIGRSRLSAISTCFSCSISWFICAR